MNIKSKEVSVIVQGAVDEKVTKKCLKSIRKYLPDAQIILSTWEGSDISGLDYDDIVLNKDPGACFCGLNDGKPNNINRMLLSTQQGLLLCKRKYTLKLRSDLILKNNKILHINDLYKRTDTYKIFQNRIFANNIFTIKYESSKDLKHYRPFHVSDWWFFGLTDDIKHLFDVHLVKEPDFSRYFLYHEMPQNKFHKYPYVSWQFSPEQYLQIQCMQNHNIEVDIKHILDYNQKNITQSELYVVNNYLILTEKMSGIYCAKKMYKYYDFRLDSVVCDSVYTKYIWLCDYKKYIDNNYTFNPIYKLAQEVLQTRTYKKLLKHLNRVKWLFKDLFMFPFRLVNQIISIVFYTYKVIIIAFEKIKDNKCETK